MPTAPEARQERGEAQLCIGSCALSTHNAPLSLVVKPRACTASHPSPCAALQPFSLRHPVQKAIVGEARSILAKHEHEGLPSAQRRPAPPDP